MTPDEAERAERKRGRLRVLALAALVGFWLAPWAEIQTPDGSTVRQPWAEHAGAVGGLALLASWGLAATALVARTRRGRRIGAALTDAAVAFATTGLLVLLHGWMPGGAHRETWVLMFLPLGLLATLEAFVVARRPDAGGEVTFLRAGASLFAAAALVVTAAWLPAGVALWLAGSAIAHGRATTPGSSRRILEAQMVLAACLAILAPVIQRALVGETTPVAEFAITFWGWTAIALVLAAIAAVGLVGPTPRRPDAAPA